MEQVQAALQSGDPQAVASAEAFLNGLREKYPEYLAGFLEILENPGSISMLAFAATILYREGKTMELYSNGAILEDFTRRILSLMPGLLAADVPKYIKMMVMDLLALIAITMYRNDGDVSIQRLMLSMLSENPLLEEYLVHTVACIVSSADDCGGYDTNDLYSVITTSSPGFCYTPRFDLFIALARKFPETPEVHGMFHTFLTGIPDDLEVMEHFLKSLGDFAEEKAEFLYPHLQDLMAKLCEISLNRAAPEELRVASITVFSSIAIGSPNMCAHSQVYYVPLLTTLIQVIAEVDEDNDISTISASAVEALDVICEDCGCEPEYRGEWSEVIEKIRESSIVPGVSWNIVYALLAVYAVLDQDTLSRWIYPASATPEALGSFLGWFLEFTKPENRPEIRMKAMDALVNILGYYRHQILATLDLRSYIPPIVGMLAEMNPELNDRLYKIIRYLLEHSKTHQLSVENYAEVYGHILEHGVQMLSTGNFNIDILVKYVALLSHLLPLIGEKLADLADMLFGILERCMQLQNMSVAVRVIYMYGLLLQNEITKARIDVPSIFGIIASLKEQVTDGNDIYVLDVATQWFLESGTLPIQLYGQIANVYFTILEKDIEIVYVNAFERDFCTVGYHQVVSTVAGAKAYISESAKQEICSAFKLIAYCISTKREIAQELIPKAVMASHKWIMHENMSVEIAYQAWVLLCRIATYYPSAELAAVIIGCSTMIQRDECTSGCTETILETLHMVLVRMKQSSIVISDESQIVTIIDLIAFVIQKYEEQKQKNVENASKYVEVDPNRKSEDSREDDVLSSLSDVIFAFVSMFGDPAATIVKERIQPHILRLMGSEIFICSAVKLMVSYLRAAGPAFRGDIKEFLGFVYTTFLTGPTYVLLWSRIFVEIGYLFQIFKFQDDEQELAWAYYNFFDQLLTQEQMVGFIEEQVRQTCYSDSNINDDICDNALVCFTKFTMVNYGGVFDDTILETWWQAWPLNESPQEGYLVYAYLLSLLNGDMGEVLAERWREDIVGRIIYVTFTTVLEPAPKVGAGLCELIRKWYNDPRLREQMEEYLESCSFGNRAEMVRNILTIEDPQLLEHLFQAQRMLEL